MRIFLLNQVPTMTVSKWPWRKSPRPGKDDVICTRLILPDVVPAVKKYGFQRGSERTICTCKCPGRTGMGGVGSTLLTILIYAPPVQADNSCLLTKFNDDNCSNTPPGSHKSRHTIPSKRGCCQEGLHPLINYLDLYLSISSRILNSCSCSSGVLAERNS